MFTLYKGSPTGPEERETGWGLFNAVTEYADWFSPVRGVDKDTIRAERILLGGMAELKDKALELLLV